MQVREQVYVVVTSEGHFVSAFKTKANAEAEVETRNRQTAYTHEVLTWRLRP